MDEDGVRHGNPVCMDGGLEGVGEQMVQVPSLSLPDFVKRLLLVNTVQLWQVVVFDVEVSLHSKENV